MYVYIFVKRAPCFSNYSDLTLGVVPGAEVYCVDQSERDVAYAVKYSVSKVWLATEVMF